MLKEIFSAILKQMITYIFGKMCMRQGILLGNFLCDGAQGVDTSLTSLVKYPQDCSYTYITLGCITQVLSE